MSGPKFFQVHYQTDECKEVIPSLPTEKDWIIGSSLHFYQGCWYTTFQINRVIPVQRNFCALDSDIFLATPPKAGTTWIKALAFALLNRSRYAQPSQKSTHPLLLQHPHELVPFVEMDLYMEDPNPDLSSYTSPRLFATHIISSSLPESINQTNCKVVYFCRNPKDTFVSFWSFIEKLGRKVAGTIPLDEAFDLFCRGISPFGPYWDHVISYYKASMEMPHKFLFMKYEDMKEKPAEELKRLADFLSCPFSKDEEADGEVYEILRLCSFDNLKKLDVNQTGQLSSGTDRNFFFRKGEVGDWANYLTLEMVERIDHITEEKFKPLGLKIWLAS